MALNKDAKEAVQGVHDAVTKLMNVVEQHSAIQEREAKNAPAPPKDEEKKKEGGA
jgi:hypothetical protein